MEKTINFKKYSRGGLVSTIMNLVEAMLWIVVGVLAIVFSNNQDFKNAVFLIIGIMLVISGALKILTNFLPVVGNNFAEALAKAKAKAEMSYSLVVGGSFELALGITFITIFATNPDLFNTLITFAADFIGIILIVVGASLILFAVGFIVSKLYKLYVPIFEILFGAIVAALGIFVLIFVHNTEDGTVQFFQICLVIAGILIILTGIAIAALTIYAARAYNQKEKARKEAEKQAAEEKKPEETAEKQSNVVDVTPIDSEPEKKELTGPQAIEHKNDSSN